MFKRLIWLTFGAFAVGTETYMIAGLLPGIASDFHVSISAVGQLVTVFALTYAISSPILSAATGNVNRRALLIWSMAAFAGGNFLAGLSMSYWLLMVVRIGLALAAGLFMPAAVAFASAFVAPKQRTRAVALVTGGITTAVALGAPVGTLLGSHAGWRVPFFAVAGLALLAVVGMTLALPRSDVRGAVPLKDRIAVLRRPVICRVLGVTVFCSLAGLMPYTYLASLLEKAAMADDAIVSAMQSIWGFGAVVGIFSGGIAADRFGSVRVIAVMVCLQLPAYVGLSVLAYAGSTGTTTVPLVLTIALWGITLWGYWPAHQARLIALDPKAAVVTLSLNQAAIYVGSSAGAALGSVVLDVGSSADLGWVAALIDVLALTLLWSSLRTPTILKKDGDR